MSAHDAPQSFGLPPSAVPSTRPPSVAPPSEHLIYMRNFLEETLVKLGVNHTYPLPKDNELNQDISTGEALVLPLLCSSINALASLLDEVDTLTNRLTHIHDSVSSVANSVPNKEEMTASLAPITSSVRNLSHRISTAPPQRPHAPLPPVPSNPKPTGKPTTTAALPKDGPTLDPNFPRVDTVNNICYGDPEAFAKSHPDSWEASFFNNGGYSRIPKFVPGHLDPVCPRRSYAQVASTTGKKKSKKASPAGVAALATPPSSTSSRPPSLPAAARRFYAPRQTHTPHPDRDTIAATFPDIAAEVLRSSNCALPLSFIAKVNSNGTVTLLGVGPSTPASDYSPFFSALAARLNKSFPVGSSPWLPFRPASNENQFAIHGLPLRYLPNDPEGLFVYLKSAILNAQGLEITSARFLNPDPDARALKDASSVVVTTTPEEGNKMGSHIFLLSRRREVKVAHSANKTTRCRNCQRYGHTAPVCKYDHPVCPICALHHKKTEHRCPNPTCPKGGNLRPVASCCSASPPHCANCGDDHPATDPSCPARPKRTQGELPPPTPHRSVHPPRRARWIQRRTRVGSLRPPAPLPPCSPHCLPPSPRLRVGHPPPCTPLCPSLSCSPYPRRCRPAPPGAPPAPLLLLLMTRVWPANAAHQYAFSFTTGWWSRSFSLHRTTQQPWELGCVPFTHE